MVQKKEFLQMNFNVKFPKVHLSYEFFLKFFVSLGNIIRTFNLT